MIVDLKNIIRPSKLQPKLFQVFKKMQCSKKDDHLIVIDNKNEAMGAIVPPCIMEEYQELKKKDDLYDFNTIANLDCWNNEDDDIYGEFYKTH